jgi:hypothetical protein
MVNTANGQIPVSEIVGSSLPNVQPFRNVVNANQKLSQAIKTQAFLHTTLPIHWADDKLLQTPSFLDLGAQWSSSWPTESFATDVANDLIKVETVQSTSHGSTVASYYASYGDALWKWIVQQQNFGFGDVFQVHGTENWKLVNPSVLGCFSPDPVVETSEGSRPISSLAAGDRILTAASSEFGILSPENVV